MKELAGEIMKKENELLMKSDMDRCQILSILIKGINTL